MLSIRLIIREAARHNLAFKAFGHASFPLGDGRLFGTALQASSLAARAHEVTDRVDDTPPATASSDGQRGDFEERRQRMLERAEERLIHGEGPDPGARQKLMQALKSTGRFYRTVNVKPLEGQGYQILLDRHAIKTPGLRPLVLPTLPLALAVAAEWEWQENGRPAMHSMPIMGLAATAIDQPKPVAKVVDTMLRFLHTDSACCRYESGRLADRQAEAFDPLLSWAAGAPLGWHLTTSEAVTGAPQGTQCEEKARTMLTGLDPWRLAALEQLTSAGKSLVLAAAVLHGRVTPQEAVGLARLEEDFQTEDWGTVEAGHDLDLSDCVSRVFSASVVLRLLDLPGDPPRGL